MYSSGISIIGFVIHFSEGKSLKPSFHIRAHHKRYLSHMSREIHKNILENDFCYEKWPFLQMKWLHRYAIELAQRWNGLTYRIINIVFISKLQVLTKQPCSILKNLSIFITKLTGFILNWIRRQEVNKMERERERESVCVCVCVCVCCLTLTPNPLY